MNHEMVIKLYTFFRCNANYILTLDTKLSKKMKYNINGGDHYIDLT